MMKAVRKRRDQPVNTDVHTLRFVFLPFAVYRNVNAQRGDIALIVGDQLAGLEPVIVGQAVRGIRAPNADCSGDSFSINWDDAVK
jgi:hypothetical protein